MLRHCWRATPLSLWVLTWLKYFNTYKIVEIAAIAFKKREISHQNYKKSIQITTYTRFKYIWELNNYYDQSKKQAVHLHCSYIAALPSKPLYCHLQVIFMVNRSPRKLRQFSFHDPWASSVEVSPTPIFVLVLIFISVLVTHVQLAL